MKRMRLSHICTLALLGCITARPASGQVEPPDTTDAIPIPGVTVTVLRMPFDLARVPFSVSVNEEREIRRGKPGLGLDEAFRGIPGVQVDNRFNYALGERITIRGAGARAQFGVRGVRVVVDDVPATFADGQTSLSHVDVTLLRRAEVIRGPASSLYGNTAGGVVKLETAPPPDAPFRQEVGVTAGSNGLLKLHAGAGGRSGALGYRVDLSRLGYEGYRAFADAENRRFNGRFGYTGARDAVSVTVSAVDYEARNPGSLNAQLLEEDRSQAYGFNRAQRTGEDGRQAQVGAVWRRALGGGELEVGGHAISRSVANPIPPTIIDLDRAAGGLRALVRGGPDAAAAGGLRYTVGIDVDLQRDDRLNHDNEAGERGALTLDQSERVTNVAGFAQLDARLGQRLTLLGGVRYDWFRFAADDRLISANDPDDSGERVMDAVSPSVGLTYSAPGALDLFSNVSTSFETPTTTELANRPDGSGGFSQELEPQRSVSVEIGARGRVGRRAAYQAALYTTAVEDALIPFQVAEVEGRDFFRNAGSILKRGVEFGLTVAPRRGVRLQAAYTFTDARFEDYTVGAAVHDGNRVPGIAPHRLEVGAALEAAGGWFASADHLYMSEMPVDDANEFDSSGYGVLDLRGGHERLRVGTITLAPFVGVTNVLDTEYNTSVTVNAFGGRYYEPGPGRAVYGGVTLRLGGGR